MRRLLLLPVAVVAVFAPIAAFGTAGVPLAVLIGAVLLAWFLFGLTTVATLFLGLLLLLLLFIAVIMPAVESAWSASARHALCVSNLRQINMAIHAYHAKYGCFPPAYIVDKNGKPMHSWRVLILPFLDQSGRCTDYRFDEPWDWPNNRKLHLVAMPYYHCPGDRAGPERMTSYVAVVGAGTAWPGSANTKLSDFADGASQTIMVVETTNSGIHWMEPKDLDIDEALPAAKPKSRNGISSKHRGWVGVAFADGHAESLAGGLSPGILRAMLTIHGGERLMKSRDGSWKLADPVKGPS